MDSHLQSRTIEWLRFPMATMVVLLHTGSLGAGSQLPVYRTLCLLTADGICRLAVPLFFFFSGYLFFQGLDLWDNRVYLGKLKRRVKTLLVPYVLWNILAAVFIWGYAAFRARLHGDIVVSWQASLKDWGYANIFWDVGKGYPLDFPLWFVRDLMILVILAPIIHLFVVRFHGFGIATIALVYVFFGKYGFIEGSFFFTLGAYFKITHSDIRSFLSRYRLVAFVLCPISLIASVVLYTNHIELYHIVVRLFILFGCAVLYLLTAHGLEKGSLTDHPRLANSAFFIFASHGILILPEFAHYIMLHLLPFRNEAYHCINLFLQPMIAIGLCLGLFFLLGRYTPKTLSLLTGGRAIDKK